MTSDGAAFLPSMSWYEFIDGIDAGTTRSFEFGTFGPQSTKRRDELLVHAASGPTSETRAGTSTGLVNTNSF
jgi:hypothetical protein